MEKFSPKLDGFRERRAGVGEAVMRSKVLYLGWIALNLGGAGYLASRGHLDAALGVPVGVNGVVLFGYGVGKWQSWKRSWGG